MVGLEFIHGRLLRGKALKFPLTILTLFLAAFVVGCGSKQQDKDDQPTVDGKQEDEQDSRGGSETQGAVFEDGKGIRLSAETIRALELETVLSSLRRITPSVPVTAQVYRESGERIPESSWMRPGMAYASAMVASSDATSLKVGDRVTFKGSAGDYQGEVVRFDHQTEAITGQVEMLFAIPDPQSALKIRQFLEGSALVGTSSREVVTVPTSAVVRSASGNFVYVVQGDYYLRTQVTLGLSDENGVEIREGIAPGVQVVSKPADQLWLIELRAVKGGGDD